MRNAPMFLTLGNALLGLFAIYLILTGRYEAIIYVILAGAILDGMDGWAARKMGVASALGASADMVSDLVSFGVVPAVLVAKIGGMPWGILTGALYFLAISYRLLRWRLSPGIERGFVGMPSPMTALMVISLSILASRYPGLKLLAAAAGVTFGLLAATRIQFPKWGHPAVGMLPKKAWIAFYSAHLIFFIFRPVEAVLSLMLVYMFLGPSLVYRYRAKQNALNGAGVS